MEKVLIVDDEASLRRLVTATLRGAGYQVLEASDGRLGIELARRERPAILLLDVQMPGLDGFEVCRQVKSDLALRGTTVVMLTAQAQSEARRRASAAGADEFMTKPFSPLQLLQVVDRGVNAG